jgi:4-oxalocrotonate tautomerase family enzyme
VFGLVELPVVQVSVWAGMSEENKKKVAEGMTRVLEELGIPREAVTVIIYEAPKTNWALVGNYIQKNMQIDSVAKRISASRVFLKKARNVHVEKVACDGRLSSDHFYAIQQYCMTKVVE